MVRVDVGEEVSDVVPVTQPSEKGRGKPSQALNALSMVSASIATTSPMPWNEQTLSLSGTASTAPLSGTSKGKEKHSDLGFNAVATVMHDM